MLTAKIAGGFLCLLQKLLAMWNLWWVSCCFSLLKLHLGFELLILPKMCQLFSARHMTHTQHRFTKYYTCQVFNRKTECDYVWRIPRWIIIVSKFLVEVNFFICKHQAKWVQPQLCLLWNLIFSKSTLTPIILCLKSYLEQTCSFDIWNYFRFFSF